jgi:mannose-6-phosphate isomerase
MCVDGDVEISTEHSTEKISKGETVLLPAAFKHYTLKSKAAKLLEIYV